MSDDREYQRRYRELNRDRIQSRQVARRALLKRDWRRDRLELKLYDEVLTPSERVEMIAFEAEQRKRCGGG